MTSFRLKIALLSGGITGLLLVGTGLVGWRISYQFNLDRLDREIRNLGQSNLERVPGREHWVRLDDALRFVSGRHASAGYVLWVKHDGQTVYQSLEWPKQLELEPLPLGYKEETSTNGDRNRLPAPPRRGERISSSNPALPIREAPFYTRQSEGKTWRIGVMSNPYVTLLLAANMDEFHTHMAALRNTYLAVLPVVLLLAALGAWFLASRALRPVLTLTRMAERITARGLDQRIPAMSQDQEFQRLITVFNDMMGRLESSFQQATRFTADASHELKTPLARLQVELEEAVEKGLPGSPEQETFSSLLEEISRLKAIVQKLLLLALADAGRLQLHRRPVRLNEILANVIQDCQAQAPHLTVEYSLAKDAAIDADPDLLEQALQNLSSNAIKYNHEQGCIRFETAKSQDQVSVRVANTGPGIPPVDHSRIFERFYRSDKSRSGRVEGVGLGLNLSREIVRAHGGDLSLDTSDHALTVFKMWLPLARKNGEES